MVNYPDNNLAESLQRITGVSIDRDSGEGRKISIRGLGPEFAAVYLNGRQIASEESSRSFSLDTISSDMVRTLNVYKSTNPKITEGGLGGTVDIKTARPFDNDGFVAVANLKAIHTETSGETEPQFSALASNTFLDGQFGVLASVNMYKRTQQNNSAATWATLTDDTGWAGVPENQKQVAQFGLSASEDVRERKTLNLVAQWQASDDVLVTADFMHNKFDSFNEGFAFNYALDWANPDWDGEVLSEEPDSTGKITRLKFKKDGTTFENAYNTNGRDVTAQLFGLNVDWYITDTLQGEFDAFLSKALNDDKGLRHQAIIRYYPPEDESLDVVYDYTAGGDVPSLTRPDGSLDGLQPSEEQIGSMMPSTFNHQGNYTDAENKGFKADFTYDPEIDVINNIEFGASYAQNNKLNIYYSNYNSQMAPDADYNIEKLFEINAGVNEVDLEKGKAYLPVPEELLTVKDFGIDVKGINTKYFSFDWEEYIDWMSAPETLQQLETSDTLSSGDAQALVDEWGFGTHKNGTESFIEETITAAYATVNWRFDIGSMPLNVMSGLRFTQTDISSTGSFPKLIDLVEPTNPTQEQIEQGALEAVYEGGPDKNTRVTTSNTYSNVLPAISASLNITNDLILRSSVSRSLTRPHMDALNPGIYPSSLYKDERRAGAGNPFLKPYDSLNKDISLEWYYSDDSMFTVAYFTKDISDWILDYQEVVSDQFFDLKSPEYNEFTIVAPDNVDEAGVSGVELNWMHMFDIGVGFQVNRTWVDSEVDEDAAFTMVGISNNANFAVFYENDVFETRLAYNIRDSFLVDPNLFGLSPLHAQEYKQLDASANYDISDNVNIYLEANNLLNEKWRTYAHTQQDWMSYSETGRRFAAGVRVSF